MKRGKTSFFLIFGLLFLLGIAVPYNAVTAYAADNLVPGTGMLTGKVTATKSFEAAKVYAHNLDKDMIYMVYTGDGRYEMVAMFPGSYEVWVDKTGFESDRRKIQVQAGADLNLDFSLREVPPQVLGQGTLAGRGRRYLAETALMLPYDELYPDGPGKTMIEQTCIQCHGQNFLTFQKRNTQEWNEIVGLMLEIRIPPGTMSSHQRQEVAEYLGTHFGPDSPDRRLKIEAEIPLDETVLSKAQYVEYLIPLDESRPKRWIQEVHVDFLGNVWYTERSLPHAVGRLDPRTGEVTEWVLPDPEGDPHGLTVDSQGYVYWAEVDKGHLGRLDSRTGEMERFPYDGTGGTLGELAGHTPVLDSKENVWFTLIRGDSGMGMWDRETKKVQVWRVPSKDSLPYGMDIGTDGTIALAELYGCRVAVFDTKTETFTEYPALASSPCKTRRLGIDSKGIIWYGVFSQGKLGKFNLKTGEQVEFDMASRFAEPYSVKIHRQTDLIWISDGGMGGALIQFNSETEKFTYYPTPRQSDMPKIDVTSDGNVWYSTRAIDAGGVGVLYPDKSKITSLAARR